MTAALISELPDADTGAGVAHDLLNAIRSAINEHPRSKQKRIGPSEIGMPCTRRLIHKLAGHDEPDRGDSWKPTIGTAGHAWLETVFAAENRRVYTASSRYQIEAKVCVGEINGQDITGSCDLFDMHSGAVVDWKFVGPSRLRAYKANGPGKQYRTQAHLYGRGWARTGCTVNTVMIMFLPRDGELRDAYPWHEAYDEQIALAALQRAGALAQLIASFGADQVLTMYPACDDPFCPWCGTGRPFQRTGGTFFNPTYSSTPTKPTTVN